MTVCYKISQLVNSMPNYCDKIELDLILKLLS